MTLRNLSLAQRIVLPALALFLISACILFTVQHLLYVSGFEKTLGSVQESVLAHQRYTARDLMTEITFATEKSLQRGEYEQFVLLADQQVKLEQVDEFSFINSDARVALSSQTEQIGRKIEPAIWERAQNEKDTFVIEDDNALSLYQPLRVDADMLRLNPLASAGELYGVLYLKFSKDKINAMLNTARGDFDANVSRTKLLTASLSGAVAIFIGICMTMIGRSIARPMLQATDVAERIARGDFSQRLNFTRTDETGRLAAAMDRMSDSLTGVARLAQQIADGNLSVEVELASERDELGQALQTMVSGLNDVIGQVDGAVTQVAIGTRHISESSQSVSDAATEQASSLEEISAAMTEMGSQTRLNADHANEADQLSASAKKSAEQGDTYMTQMVSSMEAINESSTRISKIIKVIDDIAFQTNLLALNAAVEAARAGKHGKGFAVVAEEVRNLAARSAKAARETAALIETSIERVRSGMQIAGDTATALREIFTGVSKTADLVADIKLASNEQALGITQVNQGISQLEQAVCRNTGDAEECAAAAEELSGQAHGLRELVARFQLKPIPGDRSPSGVS